MDEQAKDDSLLTEYVATRWYRAPEIMVSQRCYHKASELFFICLILLIDNDREYFS